MEQRILSVQVGKPRTMTYPRADGQDTQWSSGIFKSPVDGPVWVGRTNLEGDGQDDLEHHGGEDRAVLLFSKERYAHYEAELGLQIAHGGFGENVTVLGGDETTVCLGDVWRCGEVVLEVSQPRIPCFKLGRRLDRPEVVQRLMADRAAGWYCRVLSEGSVSAGDRLTLERRPLPEWTVSRAFDVFVFRRSEPTSLKELASVGTLSNLWKSRLAQFLASADS